MMLSRQETYNRRLYDLRRIRDRIETELSYAKREGDWRPMYYTKPTPTSISYSLNDMIEAFKRYF